MAVSLGSDIRIEAKKLRSSGFSLSEISEKLGVAKSTASIWVKAVILSETAVNRIENLRTEARQKVLESIRNKHLLLMNQINKRSYDTLLGLDLTNPKTCKILCSLLYWGEGGKTDNHISFINSDPKMISAFVTLLRRSFELDESKFRGLVHIHEYHVDIELRSYWSQITKVPMSQFSKSYLKPHTGKSIHAGYMGTLKLKYFDVKIAHELKAIYNTLVELLGV